MTTRATRRRVLHGGVVVGGIALAGCLGGDDEDEEGEAPEEGEAEDEGTEDEQAEEDEQYEVWAFDQGTDIGYIYEPAGDGEAEFDLVEEIDFHDIEDVTPNEEDAITPHMVAFSSDFAYAAVACTNAAQTVVFRTEDREAVGVLDTGPGSHFAGFTPDDEYLQVDVIGEGTVARIDATLDEGEESFEIADEIRVREAGPVADRLDEFELDDEELRPICHDYTDTGFSYHTLGPSIDHSGVVVVDWEAFEVTEAIAPEQVRANCGTIAHPEEDKFYLTAGAPSNHEPTGGVGEWYVFDTNEHRPIDPETDEVVEGDYTYEDVARDSHGYDAHGFWFVNEEDLWIVNRETSDGALIDPETDEAEEEIETAEAPDILWGSPDEEYVFVTQRGPNPVSGDPHASTGDTPGVGVQDAETSERIEVLQPDADNPDSDFHAVGVRVIDGDEDADFG